MGDTKVCPACGGSGARMSNSTVSDCPRCDGNGYVKLGVHEKMSRGDRQVLGGTGGAITGFAAAGPVGAVVGGLLGLALTSDDRDEGLSGN